MYFGKIIINKKETEDIHLLGIKTSKELLKNFKPGQFVKIKINSRLDPLIPRPFTIHAVEDDVFFILFQIKGKGTRALSKVKEGEEVEFLAPLGKSFPALENYVVCAGGIGIAGFGYLLQYINVDKSFKRPYKLYYGAKTQSELVRLDFLKKWEVPLEIATDDGSSGYKGFITDLVEKDLKKEPRDLLACGPLPMLKRIAKIGEKYKTKAYLVMETFLACGIGFCKGCVIPLKKGNYVHLCIDGPTFLAEEINFEALG